jgi:hypothetical protein
MSSVIPGLFVFGGIPQTGSFVDVMPGSTNQLSASYALNGKFADFADYVTNAGKFNVVFPKIPIIETPPRVCFDFVNRWPSSELDISGSAVQRNNSGSFYNQSAGISFPIPATIQFDSTTWTMVSGSYLNLTGNRNAISPFPHIYTKFTPQIIGRYKLVVSGSILSSALESQSEIGIGGWSFVDPNEYQPITGSIFYQIGAAAGTTFNVSTEYEVQTLGKNISVISVVLGTPGNAFGANYSFKLDGFRMLYLGDTVSNDDYVFEVQSNDFVIADFSSSINRMNIKLPSFPSNKDFVNVAWPIWNSDSNILKVYSNDKQIKFGTGSLANVVDFISTGSSQMVSSIGNFIFDSGDDIWRGGINRKYSIGQFPGSSNFDGLDLNYWGDGSSGSYIVTSNENWSSSTETVVKMFEDLTINPGVTVTAGGRGTVIYCLGDCIISGSINATGNATNSPGNVIFARYTTGSMDIGSSSIALYGTGMQKEMDEQGHINGNGELIVLPVGSTGTSGGGASDLGSNGAANGGSRSYSGPGAGSLGTPLGGGGSGGDGQTISAQTTLNNGTAAGGGGGAGGGTVILIVKGSLIINGSIVSNGAGGAGGDEKSAWNQSTPKFDNSHGFKIRSGGGGSGGSGNILIIRKQNSLFEVSGSILSGNIINKEVL